MRLEASPVPRLTKLRRVGHGERFGVAWRLVWVVLYAPTSLLIKVRYRHLERFPQQGAVIVVVNHVSHVDPVLVSKLVLDAARVPRFLAKETIFEVPVVGAAMRAMGHIPVRRDTTDAARSLEAAVRALGSGRVIVLHPEGTVTRDPDGWPMAGRSGAARLSMLAPDVPVVPVAQWGVQDSIDLYRRRARLIPRPRHELSVGQPIDLSAFRDREPNSKTLHEMTDVIIRRLRHDVAELRGEPEPTGDPFRWTRRRADGDVA
jgi:1-acyl-sn-glycerol-3-phosphate acyltransferase